MSNRLLTLLQQMVISLIMIAVVAVAYQTLAAPNAQSSVPIVIPYQGKLSDSVGTPINSSVNITFRFYAVASGGSAIWTETHSNVTVSNGLFRVMLGSVTAIPATVWSNNPLYVGVQVGSEAEMTPREQIGAVPYSIVAGNALSVADGAVTLPSIAQAATQPSRVQTWQDVNAMPLAVNGAGLITIDINPNITVTVPIGKAYYYLISYRGVWGYDFANRVGSNTGYYAEGYAHLYVNNQLTSQVFRVVHTGYRQDWNMVGGSSYWRFPYNAMWSVRLEGGTHNIKIRMGGFSDNTMSQAKLEYQSIQVMQLY